MTLAYPPMAAIIGVVVTNVFLHSLSDAGIVDLPQTAIWVIAFFVGVLAAAIWLKSPLSNLNRKIEVDQR